MNDHKRDVVVCSAGVPGTEDSHQTSGEYYLVRNKMRHSHDGVDEIATDRAMLQAVEDHKKKFTFIA